MHAHVCVCLCVCACVCMPVYICAVPPLFVLEFLHRACDIFEDYFKDCSESVLKEHYVTVFEVKDSWLAGWMDG